MSIFAFRIPPLMYSNVEQAMRIMTGVVISFAKAAVRIMKDIGIRALSILVDFRRFMRLGLSFIFILGP